MKSEEQAEASLGRFVRTLHAEIAALREEVALKNRVLLKAAQQMEDATSATRLQSIVSEMRRAAGMRVAVNLAPPMEAP